MNKYIYGMAASSYWMDTKDIRGMENSLYVVDTNSIKLAEEVAFTLQHDPKLLINTTNHSDMKLYRNSEGIFFRYPIDNGSEEDKRLYRFVKQGKYRQCSYIRLYGEFRRKIDWENKWPGSNQKMFIEKKSLLFEICLTNHPVDTNTFCTIDIDDERLSNIDWSNPLEMGTEGVWQRHLEREKKLKLIQEYKELEKERLKIEKDLA